MEKYQTFWQRFAAALLDGLIFLPFTWLLPDVINIDTATSIPWVLFNNGLFFIYSIYGHGNYGFTLGKKWMNIRVVSNSDETKLIGLLNALKRDVIAIAFCFLQVSLLMTGTADSTTGAILIFAASFGWLLAELITMLLNPKRRSVHDLIAGSVVIDIAKKDRWQGNDTAE